MRDEEPLTAELEIIEEREGGAGGPGWVRRRVLRLNLRDAQGQTRATRELAQDAWDPVLHVAPEGHCLAVTFGEALGEYAAHVFWAFAVGGRGLEEVCRSSRLPASSRQVLPAPALSWEEGSVRLTWPPGSRAFDDSEQLTEVLRVPAARGARVVAWTTRLQVVEIRPPGE
jgi:hypothetical protein